MKPGFVPDRTFPDITDRLVYAGARMLAVTFPVTTEQAAIDKALWYLTDPDFQDAPDAILDTPDMILDADRQRIRAIYATAVLAVWNESRGT